MKAAVYTGKQRLEVRDIEVPTPKEGEVLVKVKYCAICGTDVHAFLYDIAPPGTVMGHEYCGTVEQVGPGVSRWSVGDRVVGGGGTPPAGKEPPIRVNPRYNYRTMGFEGGRQRAYAEYVIMDEWEPLPLPDGVSDEDAALCEPLAVAVHAVRISPLKLGDSVVVLGGGPIGLLTLQAARAAGARQVIISEPAPARAEAARSLNADAVINPLEEDVVERVVKMTDGQGADVVFECAAARDTLHQAFDMVRRGGHVTLVAVPWEPVSFLPVDWMAREVQFSTSFGSRPPDWRISLDLIATGKVTMDPLVSEAGFLPLDSIQQAFEELVKPSTQVQMVVRP